MISDDTSRILLYKV